VATLLKLLVTPPVVQDNNKGRELVCVFVPDTTLHLVVVSVKSNEKQQHVTRESPAQEVRITRSFRAFAKRGRKKTLHGDILLKTTAITLYYTTLIVVYLHKSRLICCMYV